MKISKSSSKSLLTLFITVYVHFIHNFTKFSMPHVFYKNMNFLKPLHVLNFEDFKPKNVLKMILFSVLYEYFGAISLEIVCFEFRKAKPYLFLVAHCLNLCRDKILSWASPKSSFFITWWIFSIHTTFFMRMWWSNNT